LSPTDTELKKLPRSTGYEYILNEKKFILILSESAINELHYDNGNGFVELMTSSYQDNVLYKRYYIEKKEGRKASNTYQKDIPPKFILESRYIIKFKDKFVRVEAHKKRVLEKFPDNIKELKKFIDDNKLKFRGDEEEIDKEMVMLVNYYNSI
jgi:hypothetical protein